MTKIKFRDSEYRSLAELARFYGKDENKVLSRVSKLKWSLEEALELVPRDKIGWNRKKVTAFGKEFDSIPKMLAYFNIESRSQFNYFHLEKGSGMSVEDALIECLKRRVTSNVPAYVVFGEPFNSYREIGDRFGVTGDQIRYRVERKYMSAEEAVSDVLNNKKTYNVFGDTYKTIKEACDYYGIKEERVYKSLREGEGTLEEIMLRQMVKIVDEYNYSVVDNIHN